MGQAVLVIILGVINWIIYHKIFRVYYFGSVARNIMKEIAGCMFAACIELAIITVIGGEILGAVLNVGKWLLGIVITIVFIIGLVLALREIHKTFKDAKNMFAKKNSSETKEEVSAEDVQEKQ